MLVNLKQSFLENFIFFNTSCLEVLEVV